MFPTEIEEVYFIPYSSGKSGLRKQPARGKLWSRYINIKAQVCLLNKENIQPPIEPLETETVSDEANDGSLEFLRSSVVPFPKILLAWEKTYKYRTIHYSEEDINNLFSDFPCLKQDSALSLVIKQNALLDTHVIYNFILFVIVRV